MLPEGAARLKERICNRARLECEVARRRARPPFLKVLEKQKAATAAAHANHGGICGTDKIIIDGKAGQGVVPFLPLDQLQKRKEGGN